MIDTELAWLDLLSQQSRRELLSMIEACKPSCDGDSVGSIKSDGYFAAQGAACVLADWLQERECPIYFSYDRCISLADHLRDEHNHSPYTCVTLSNIATRLRKSGLRLPLPPA